MPAFEQSYLVQTGQSYFARNSIRLVNRPTSFFSRKWPATRKVFNQKTYFDKVCVVHIMRSGNHLQVREYNIICLFSCSLALLIAHVCQSQCAKFNRAIITDLSWR